MNVEWGRHQRDPGARHPFRHSSAPALRWIKGRGAQHAARLTPGGEDPLDDPPVDHQQSRADHERADRLPQAERFAESEMREHDRADRHQQRDQHDIGGAGAGEDAVEHEISDAGRENAETDKREPCGDARHGEGPGPVDRDHRQQQNRARRHGLTKGRGQRRDALQSAAAP